MIAQAFQIDPTRTSLQRRSFVADMRKRFAAVQQAVWHLIANDTVVVNADLQGISSINHTGSFTKFWVHGGTGRVKEFPANEEHIDNHPEGKVAPKSGNGVEEAMTSAIEAGHIRGSAGHNRLHLDATPKALLKHEHSIRPKIREVLRTGGHVVIDTQHRRPSESYSIGTGKEHSDFWEEQKIGEGPTTNAFDFATDPDTVIVNAEEKTVYRVHPPRSDLHGTETETSAGNPSGGVHVFTDIGQVGAVRHWMKHRNIELATVKVNPAHLKPNEDYEGSLLPKGKGRIVARKRFRDNIELADWADQEARNLTTNAFDFATDPDKIDHFQKWLQRQINLHILETRTVTGNPSLKKPWLAPRIISAYKIGLARAYTDVKRASGASTAGLILTPEMKRAMDQAFEAGKLQRHLEAGMAVSTRKVELIYTRAYRDLQGITQDMSMKLSRILATGMINGDSPHTMARKMVRQISGISLRRATMIARTELVAAHAEGTLDGLEEMGVRRVTAEVEFQTAGDERVCPKCKHLEGKRFTIDQARGKIPQHPLCRCSWLPV